MFFGNMQSYYRRNTIHTQSSSHGSQSKSSKEQVKRVKHVHKNEDGNNEEDCSVTGKYFSFARNPDNEEPVNSFQGVNVPVIKIGLHEAEHRVNEKVPWRKGYRDQDDNSERLGPNKNNIIEETLRLERRKSGEWKQQL